MKLFLWRRINQVSNNYHPEGGLVVIAEDHHQAKQAIARANAFNGHHDAQIELTQDEWEQAIVLELADNSLVPQVFIFPDAGCC